MLKYNSEALVLLLLPSWQKFTCISTGFTVLSAVILNGEGFSWGSSVK